MNPWTTRSALSLRRAAVLLFALAVAGCSTMENATDPAFRGPFFEPKNFTGVPALPASVRRVVVLPVAGAPGVPSEALVAIDPVVSAELQRQARFEVVTVDSESLMRLCDRQRLLSVDALPPDFLALLAKAYEADAVLFVDITSYAPYPPLALGFRAKLALAADGSILWAFDTTFSSQDPAIVNAARRHALQSRPASVPGDAAYSVLRSPVRFADYVTAAAFATLPRR